MNTGYYLLSKPDLDFSYVEGLRDIQLVANYIQSALGQGKDWVNEVRGGWSPQLPWPSR